MRAHRIVIVVLSLAGVALAGLAACSDLEASGLEGLGDGGPEGSSGGPSGLDGGAAAISVDALVLVHAARFPAFRVCFENDPASRPLPDSDVMADSNVVGIDEGTAVRLPAPGRIPVLGRAFVFAEPAIRALYPAFGGAQAGPTCGQLLAPSSPQAPQATEVGAVDTSLRQGVHALILEGCRAAAQDPGASATRCGATWEAETGNLGLRVVPLVAYARASQMGGFPVQLLQLSPSLDNASAGRALGLGFGPLDAGVETLAAPLVEGRVPYGLAVPNPPAFVRYDADDVPGYATNGLFLTLGGPLDDAGLPLPVDAGTDARREVLLAESLERVQSRSASQSLPTRWFAFGSSYVLVSVGETEPLRDDGGLATDDRRALHLLAIPLATPDAGGDAGP